jgi:hypothetical protein
VVGASNTLPVRRPWAQRHMNSPESALVADRGALVSQAPVCFLVCQVLCPSGRVAIHEEIHRQLVCSHCDLALQVDRTDGAIGTPSSALTAMVRSRKKPRVAEHDRRIPVTGAEGPA